MSMNKFKLPGALILVSLAASCATAPTGAMAPNVPTDSPEGERILSFHSQIGVRQDGSADVTETITVRAEGNKIRHGIYRTLPVSYQDPHGDNRKASVEVLTLLRDDAREDFHTSESDNSVRIYFGNSTQVLAPGVYKYTFRYRFSPATRFFDDHDELYWNVTGNGWGFAIDKSSATVLLEGGNDVMIQSADAFTGTIGARGKDYISRSTDSATIIFESTKVLLPGEGLTILVRWSKGPLSAQAIVRNKRLN